MVTWDELRARVLLETPDLLVLDKPVGVSVMGERHDDDVITLAAAAGEPLRWVHRIDKVTSGVVLLARTADAHAMLTRQFADRSVEKTYLAVTASAGLEGQGTIDLPLTTGRKNRVRIAAPRDAIAWDAARRTWGVPAEPVMTGSRSVDALTHYRVLGSTASHTLLELHPVTGRRHQLRVQLAWLGHPIAGDPLFDTGAAARGDRCCLHAQRLVFTAPSGDRRLVEAPPDAGFWRSAPSLEASCNAQ